MLDVIKFLEPGAATKFLTTVVAVDNLVNSIPSGVNATIPLGSFNLEGNGLDARTSNLSTATLSTASVTDVLSELNGLGSGVAGFVSQITDKAMFGGAGGDDGGGVQFPLIQNPKLAFGLLLGQNVPLFTFDMPTLRAEFQFDQFFSILGPLGIELKGTVPEKLDPSAPAYTALS